MLVVVGGTKSQLIVRFGLAELLWKTKGISLGDTGMCLANVDVNRGIWRNMSQ